jgi:hypothetical protein
MESHLAFCCNPSIQNHPNNLGKMSTTDSWNEVISFLNEAADNNNNNNNNNNNDKGRSMMMARRPLREVLSWFPACSRNDKVVELGQMVSTISSESGHITTPCFDVILDIGAGAGAALGSSNQQHQHPIRNLLHSFYYASMNPALFSAGYPTCNDKLKHILQNNVHPFMSLIVIGRMNGQPVDDNDHCSIIAAITVVAQSQRVAVVVMVAVTEQAYSLPFCGNCDGIAFRRRGLMSCLLEISCHLVKPLWNHDSVKVPFCQRPVETVAFSDETSPTHNAALVAAHGITQTETVTLVLLIPKKYQTCIDVFEKVGFVNDSSIYERMNVSDMDLSIFAGRCEPYFFTSKFCLCLQIDEMFLRTFHFNNIQLTETMSFIFLFFVGQGSPGAGVVPCRCHLQYPGLIIHQEQEPCAPVD